MKNKETLYLVYWDNGKYVGGYEKRGDDYSQVFNDPIDWRFVYEKLKEYKEIKVMTQAELAKVHKIYFLQDYLRDEDKMSKYNADHAAEWMKMHPHGWYNSEDDKGTGDEDDDYDEDIDDYF